MAWVKGDRMVRISRAQVQFVSDALIELQPFVPDAFARKPRSLVELDRWKAKEHRQFLLYTGKIVLNDILKREVYNHFLAFSIAMSILVCPTLCMHHIEFAEKFLKYFVMHGRKLYGKEFLVYNVHSLLPIGNDV